MSQPIWMYSNISNATSKRCYHKEFFLDYTQTFFNFWDPLSRKLSGQKFYSHFAPDSLGIMMAKFDISFFFFSYLIPEKNKHEINTRKTYTWRHGKQCTTSACNLEVICLWIYWPKYTLLLKISFRMGVFLVSCCSVFRSLLLQNRYVQGLLQLQLRKIA